MKKASLAGLRGVDVREGVQRRSFSGDGATLAWTTLSPGHAPRPHTHPHEQIVYIVSGRAAFTVGSETTELGPGDMLVVPPDVEHYAETVGEEPCVDLSVFSPRRDDYAAQE
jgi:quercetin dioxygenase-like cupin family protein